MVDDYYPFGMTVPNRNYSSPSYRYGFQGQEKDDEIKGNGNSLNYKFRMHDPRVGRFFAVDPLTSKYPWYTPYSFSGNKVIAWGELEGAEEIIMIYNGNNWDRIDKSQFKASKWFDIRNNYISQAVKLFKNGQAFVYGNEEYFIEKEYSIGTYISAPENGVLYYDFSGDTPVFSYSNTKEKLRYNTDGLATEAFLRYNPLGPLLHPIFSDETLDKRDRMYQDNVKNTWKSIGTLLTLGYGSSLMSGDMIAAKVYKEYLTKYSYTKLGLDLTVDLANEDLHQFAIDAISYIVGKASSQVIKSQTTDLFDREVMKQVEKQIRKVVKKHLEEKLKDNEKKTK